MNITLYHNPRCSKSRQTLQLLEERGIAPKVIEYLQTPPSKTTLTKLLSMLSMTDPRELMRKNEAPYKEQHLADPALSKAALIQAMVDHPILIQRPIVVAGDKAAIGRPPEDVLAIL